MKTITSLFALLLACSPDVLADQPVAQQAQQQAAMTHRVAELDRLIEAIHLDLKELKKHHSWLSKYNDRCLWTGKNQQHKSSIVFCPTPTGTDRLVKHPSQIGIMYVPIDLDLGDNRVKDVPVCEFPSLKSKIFADITIHSEVDAKTCDAIRSCIIKRCEALRKDMKNSEQPKPVRLQQDQQVSREAESEADDE